MQKSAKERVVAYIDGFNLYFGMIEAGLEDCRWLDVKQLVQSQLSANQELVQVKYFTSRVTDNPAKQKRQSTYIEALTAIGCKVVFGQFQTNTESCKRCTHQWYVHKEKQTDVNIATHLLTDAFDDQYDRAILVSGDSDLLPPIKAVQDRFKRKQITVFFPPERNSNVLKSAANGSIILGKKTLRGAQLPETVKKGDGFELMKPTEWQV